MDSRKILVSSLVAAALLLTGTCVAQEVHQDVVPPVISPATPGTQMRRCDNLGEFARRAAVARDSHVTRNHFIGTLPRRLDAGTMAMLDRIYASSDSADAWQRQAREACTKNIK